MTMLAIFLKPIIWPLMRFVGLLAARWGAIIVFRIIPAGRVRTALFDREFLDRHTWICVLPFIAYVALLLWIACGHL